VRLLEPVDTLLLALRNREDVLDGVGRDEVLRLLLLERRARLSALLL
jgi:hypothetical protein